jgi:hypothetical protein
VFEPYTTAFINSQLTHCVKTAINAALYKLERNFMRLALLVFLFAGSLSASPVSGKAGSYCGLVDSTTEEAGFIETAVRSLNQASRATIEKLPTLTKQQIIIAAKLMSEGDTDAPEIKNTFDAVEYMRRADGPAIIHAKAGDTKVTEIRSYPGDNPVGPIFLQGTKRIIAFDNDQDISCK